MTTTMHERDILALPMGSNDADAETIGQFIMLIGAEVFTEQEDFSGKRPFGNSGWIFGVYESLIAGKVLDGSLDEDGYLEEYDNDAGDAIIARLFDYLKNLDFSKLP